MPTLQAVPAKADSAKESPAVESTAKEDDGGKALQSSKDDNNDSANGSGVEGTEEADNHAGAGASSESSSSPDDEDPTKASAASVVVENEVKESEKDDIHTAEPPATEQRADDATTEIAAAAADDDDVLGASAAEEVEGTTITLLNNETAAEDKKGGEAVVVVEKKKSGILFSPSIIGMGKKAEIDEVHEMNEKAGESDEKEKKANRKLDSDGNGKQAGSSKGDDKSKANIDEDAKIAKFINDERTKAVDGIGMVNPKTESDEAKEAVSDDKGNDEQSVEGPSAARKRKVDDDDELQKMRYFNGTYFPAAKRSNTSAKSTGQQKAGKATTSKEGDGIVKVKLCLPPASQKLGLSLKGDKKGFGLPTLNAIQPDSPLLNSIPPHLIGGNDHWIIRVKHFDHELEGEVGIINGGALIHELSRKRKAAGETHIELTFANKASLAIQQQKQHQMHLQSVMQQHQAYQSKENGRQESTGADNAKKTQEKKKKKKKSTPNKKKLPTQIRTRGAKAVAADTHTATTDGASDEKEKQSPPMKKTPPLLPVQMGSTMTHDEIIQKALSEFFAEGQKMSLEPFCRAYSQVYAAISKTLDDNAGLCELKKNRKTGEGFSKEDEKAALANINDVFSTYYYVGSAKKQKKREGMDEQARERKRPHMPPIVPKSNCEGLQSKALDNFCADTNIHNTTGLYGNKSNLSNFRGWRHKDCPLIAQLDKYSRCTKCNNCYKNLKRQHPIVFEKAEPTATTSCEESLLPKSRDISKFIHHRLNEIGPDEKSVPNDPQLATAAKILKMKGKTELDLLKKFHGHKNMFILCEDCDCHMLKQLRKDMGHVCRACWKERCTASKSQKRAEARKDGRGDPNSNVPISWISREEMEERYKNLRELSKKLRRNIGSLEKKCAKYEADDDAKKKATGAAASVNKSKGKKNQQHPRAPLLPWPFYLNYNPIMAQDYSMPMTQGTNTKSASTSSRNGIYVLRSKVNDAPPPVNGSKPPVDKKAGKETSRVDLSNKTLSESGANPSAKDDADDIVMEEIAEESLDYASVGSSKEEPYPSDQSDDDDNEDGSEEEDNANGSIDNDDDSNGDNDSKNERNEEEDNANGNVDNDDDSNGDNDANNGTYVDFDGHLV